MTNAPDPTQPPYGQLVIAQWPDALRPAWLDQRAGWVRIDTDARGESVPGHLPRVSWDQPAPVDWQPIGFKCAARAAGTAGGNDPQDCDWPVCGCDPHAVKVIEALEESGHLVHRDKEAGQGP